MGQSLNCSDHPPVFALIDIGSITLTKCEFNLSSREKWGKLTAHV